MPTVQIHVPQLNKPEDIKSFENIAQEHGFDLKVAIVIPEVRRADERYSSRHVRESDQRVQGRLIRSLSMYSGINIGSVILRYDNNHYRDGVEPDSFPAEVSRAFGASMIPYSPAETGLIATLMLTVRLLLEDFRQGEDISYGLEGLAQCNRSYPAYDDHMDAGRCLGHANYLNDMASVNAQFVDIITTKCLDPSETYAWTVQAMSWQRGMTNPAIDVIPVTGMYPSVSILSGTPVNRDRAHRRAQAQALHDLGHDEFILWGVRNDPGKFKEAMADYARGFNIKPFQETEPDLFDKSAADA